VALFLPRGFMDKPSAFKNLISSDVVKNIASEISKVYPEFKSKEFSKLSSELSLLELKARVLLITERLKIYLPQDYLKALTILTKVMDNHKLSGFSLWPFSEYIGQFGLEHFDESLDAMRKMTELFTSEFAIRPFFLKNHTKVLKYFMKNSTHKNAHVRRWVSEGSRPLLPWGTRLPIFVMDPTHTLHLLEKLKFDDELYVRKSVANHLNDIAKNHPHVVVEVLRAWEKSCPTEHKAKIEWVKRHALRVLIKKGYQPALKLMGAEKVKVKTGEIKLLKSKLKVNDTLTFEIVVKSLAPRDQKIIVDYIIDFIKASGKHGTKIYKLKTLKLKAGEEVVLKKNHSLKPITTMKYYSGKHNLAIQVNGEVVGSIVFELKA
jgi:3-methyladenine DNA glycosylase AlkC